MEKRTENGELRNVLGSDSWGGAGAVAGGEDSAASPRSTWISEHCTNCPPRSTAAPPDPAADDSTGGGMMGTSTTLYDCAAQ